MLNERLCIMADDESTLYGCGFIAEHLLRPVVLFGMGAC